MRRRLSTAALVVSSRQDGEHGGRNGEDAGGEFTGSPAGSENRPFCYNLLVMNSEDDGSRLRSSMNQRFRRRSGQRRRYGGIGGKYES